MSVGRMLLQFIGKTAALTLLAVAFTATTAHAQAVCYVDTGGDDALDGQTPATANATIGGCIAESYVGDGIIISIEAGTYNEPVTVSDNLIFEARETGEFYHVFINDEVTVQADAVFRQDTQEGTDGIFSIGPEISGASLTIVDGSVTIEDSHVEGRVQIPAGGTVTRDDDTAVAGEITYLGEAHLIYTDDDSSATNVAAGGEFPDDFAGGSLSIDITDNDTLTFTSTSGIDSLNVAAASNLDGTINVTIPISIAGPGNVGSLDVNEDVSFTTDASVDDVNIANNIDIEFDLGAQTLVVNGDFVRLGGAFTSELESALVFVGDESGGSFTPGPNFLVATLSIDKAGQTQVITEDVTVYQTGRPSFIVAEGTTVDLGENVVNINAGGTNVAGILTSQSTVAYRTSATGIRGGGVYGSILVSTGDGLDVNVGAVTEEDIEFSGTLTLLNGGITVSADDDISPVGENAAVSVNLETPGQDVSGPGSFNALNNEYDLEYTGDMGGVAHTVGTEFATDDIRNLTFNVENGAVDGSSIILGTISGNVALNDIGAGYTVHLGAEVTIEGSLTVGETATLAGSAVTLQNASNNVAGTILNTLSLGEGVTLSGSTEEVPSTINHVTVTGGATIEDIHEISGTVTTGGGASLTIGLAHEMRITGDVILSGDSFTMASDLQVSGSVHADSGTVALGEFDLSIGGNLAGLAGVTYTSTEGAVVFVQDGSALSLTGESIPRLVLENDVGIALGSDSGISDALVDSGAASIDVANFVLTLGGDVDSDGGSFILTTGTGSLNLDAAMLTLGADATLAPPTTIAGAVTVAADPAEEVRTLDIGGDLTLAGALEMNQHHLNLSGDLLNEEGSISATDGVVSISGGAIEVDGMLQLENLTVLAATILGTATDGDLTIAGTLRLEDALNEADAADDVIIGDSASIIVAAAAPLANEPTFAGSVNLVYDTGATISGNEIPGDGSVNDVDVLTGVTLQRDLTVEGTLALAATLNNMDQSVALTLADNARLRLEGNNDVVLDAQEVDIDAAGSYTLIYAGGADAITDVEFIDGATVSELVIDVGGALEIDNSLSGTNEREAANLTIVSGVFDLNGFGFNVSGNLSISGDDLINSDTADVVLTFVGSADQEWMLESNFDAVGQGIDIELAKEGTSLVTVSGGDLDLIGNTTDASHQTLLLNGGILETVGNAEIFLYQDNTTQGFVRGVDEVAGEVSHVAGNITKFLPQGDPFATGRSARFEFPTGSPDGEYRPYALTFREDVVTNTLITVNHEDVSPDGTLGLPLDDALGEDIGSYPNYYWLVNATTSLGQAQLVDVELTATDLNLSGAAGDDLRVIRRFEGNPETNAWEIQGEAANYENLISDENGSSTAVVRVTDTSGGIVLEGARFTIGLPTGAPIFAADTPDTLIVNEGEVLTDTLSASADVGETVTFSLGGAPEFVTIDANSGILTVAPGDDEAGTYTFDVVADDGTDTATAQLTVIVTDIFNIAPAQADTAIALGQTLTIDFDAQGASAEDPITFGVDPDTTANVAIDAETGVFTFAPAFEQGGMTFSFTVFATNDIDTSSVSFEVAVGSELAYGDANNDGGLTLGDVSLVLSAVIGDTTLSAGGALVADVSGAAGVSAYDAALMLQCIANEGPTVEDTSVCGFPVEGNNKASMVASSEIAWGDLEGENGAINLPVILGGTVRNVYSIDLTANVDLAAAKLTNVKANLPDGWQLAWNADDQTGTVRIVAVGSTPISYEGEIARLVFQLNDESAAVNMTGEAFVNENAAIQLGDVNVVEVPREFALGENYPNPFNPTTTFTYSLPEASHVTVQVYDVSGRLVQTLVDAQKDAGRYDVKWDGQNSAGSLVASGLYLYRIEASNFTQVKTMMLVK